MQPVMLQLTHCTCCFADCWLSNDLSKAASLGLSSACTVACLGNSSQICGMYPATVSPCQATPKICSAASKRSPASNAVEHAPTAHPSAALLNLALSTGGSNANSLYQVVTPMYKYMGCYSDSSTSPALSDLLASGGNYSTITCANMASVKGRRYFATRSGGTREWCKKWD